MHVDHISSTGMSQDFSQLSSYQQTAPFAAPFKHSWRLLPSKTISAMGNRSDDCECGVACLSVEKRLFHQLESVSSVGVVIVPRSSRNAPIAR